MKVKQLQEIELRQARTTTAGAGAGDVTESRMTVAEKVEEYVFRLGCTNAHVLGLVLQLLTVGKVRVDFREYYERLQLVTKSDLLPRTQAIPLVETFLNTLRKVPHNPEESEFTQKIIIQPPKPPDR
jgi:hypothetical protein